VEQYINSIFKIKDSVAIQNNMLYINRWNENKQIDLTTNHVTNLNNFIYWHIVYYSLDNENFLCCNNKSIIRRYLNNDFILNSFRLKPEYQNNFKISNFIPVYNTDDYLITIFNEKEEVYKHFLWKDKKVYEIETERRLYMFNFRCFNI
jgi:hypothetical protein